MILIPLVAHHVIGVEYKEGVGTVCVSRSRHSQGKFSCYEAMESSHHAPRTPGWSQPTGRFGYIAHSCLVTFRLNLVII